MIGGGFEAVAVHWYSLLITIPSGAAWGWIGYPTFNQASSDA
jgi:hypothetical protein